MGTGGQVSPPMPGTDPVGARSLRAMNLRIRITTLAAAANRIKRFARLTMPMTPTL